MDKHMIVKGLTNPVKAIKYTKRKASQRLIETWADYHSISAEDHLSETNQNLWDEAVGYSQSLQDQLLKKYAGEVHTADFHSDAGVGGGAAHDILYFYARHKQPQTVVETGVSAGWSSRAILDALYKNKKGILYSNDLPYKERPSKNDSAHLDKEQIGILVDKKLEQRWKLHLGSDKENLPKIVSGVNAVDLFHYDSDKSYSGRNFAMEKVRPKLHASSVTIMDDISDNGFFRDFVQREDVEWEIIDSQTSGKKVGIIKGKW